MNERPTRMNQGRPLLVVSDSVHLRPSALGGRLLEAIRTDATRWPTVPHPDLADPSTQGCTLVDDRPLPEHPGGEERPTHVMIHAVLERFASLCRPDPGSPGLAELSDGTPVDDAIATERIHAVAKRLIGTILSIEPLAHDATARLDDLLAAFGRTVHELRPGQTMHVVCPTPWSSTVVRLYEADDSCTRIDVGDHDLERMLPCCVSLELAPQDPTPERYVVARARCRSIECGEMPDPIEAMRLLGKGWRE